MIYLSESLVSINLSALNNNGADNSGGVLFSVNSFVILQSSNATYNRAYKGGAVYVFNSNIVISHCVFSGNTAQYDGGVIVEEGESTSVSIKLCTFEDNFASQGGVFHVMNANGSLSLDKINAIFSTIKPILMAEYFT